MLRHIFTGIAALFTLTGAIQLEAETATLLDAGPDSVFNDEAQLKAISRCFEEVAKYKFDHEHQLKECLMEVDAVFRPASLVRTIFKKF